MSYQRLVPFDGILRRNPPAIYERSLISVGEKGAIPAVFCFDAKFAPFAAVATISLIENNVEARRIYWLYPDAAERAVSRILRSNPKLAGYVTRIPVDFSPLKNWAGRGHITSATHLRFLIPYFLDEEIAIYLDSDTLVVSELDELDQLELGKDFFAGVSDPIGSATTQLDFVKGDPYLNAGVLVMNLSRMPGNDLIDGVTRIREFYRDRILWPSQDPINKYGEGKKITLDDKWNYMVFSQSKKLPEERDAGIFEHAGIVHFIGGAKPWSILADPHIGDYWWRYGRKIKSLRLLGIRFFQTTVGRLASMARHSGKN